MQPKPNEKSPAAATAGAQSATLQAIADLLDAISIAESKPSQGPAVPLPRAMVENVVETAIAWLDAEDGDCDLQDGNFLEDEPAAVFAHISGFGPGCILSDNDHQENEDGI